MFWSWNVEDDGGGDDIVSNEKLLKQFDVGEAIRSRPLWKDGDFGIDWLKLLFTFSEPEDDDDEDPAVWSVVLVLPFATIALSLIITIIRVQVENFCIFILKIELNRKKSRKSIHEVVAVSFLLLYLFSIS